MVSRVLLLSALFVVATVSQAHAAFVSPVSYDMPNGYTGSYNYWDKNYTGAGAKTTDGAFLSGGLGDLTDGVVTSLNWFDAEPPVGGAGPYVGWVIDPVITFHFSAVTTFSTVDIHFDDANGNGGVSAPRGVVINGMSYGVSDPAGSAPFWASFDVSSLAASSTLQITLLRRTQWIFADEFRFSTGAAAVPEPGSLAMWGLCGVGLIALRNMRSRKLAC